MRFLNYSFTLLLLSSFFFLGFKEANKSKKVTSLVDTTTLKNYAIGDYFLRDQNYIYASAFYDKAEKGGVSSCLFYLSSGIAHSQKDADNDAFIKANILLTKALNLKPKTNKWSDYIEENQLTYLCVDDSLQTFYPQLYRVSLEYTYGMIYYYRGLVKYNLEDFYGTKSDIKSYHLKTKDSTSLSCYILGDTYGKMLQYNDAVKYLSYVIKHPQHHTNLSSLIGECYIKRGKCYYNLNKKTLACADFSKALELGNVEAQALIKKYCN